MISDRLVLFFFLLDSISRSVEGKFLDSIEVRCVEVRSTELGAPVDKVPKRERVRGGLFQDSRTYQRHTTLTSRRVPSSGPEVSRFPLGCTSIRRLCPIFPNFTKRKNDLGEPGLVLPTFLSIWRNVPGPVQLVSIGPKRISRNSLNPYPVTGCLGTGDLWSRPIKEKV